MTRIVFSGLFERFPGLKVVTHHLGGMVSLYAAEDRPALWPDAIEVPRLRGVPAGLTKAPIDYFKMFYVDTAIHGNTPALMLGHSFWGAEHIVFGADMPLGDPGVRHGELLPGPSARSRLWTSPTRRSG